MSSPTTGPVPRWDEAMRIAYAVGAEASARALERSRTSSAHSAAELPLTQAAGRTLVRDLVSPIPVPHFDSSAMDGFAVSGPPPWRLDDDATQPLHTPLPPLAPGRARRIVTGGPVPAGTSGVVRHEYTTRDGGVLALRPDAPASELEPGRHLRAAGREVAVGDRIASAGQPLTPARVAFAAVCGIDTVPVLPPVTAGLLLTGDEVIPAGLPSPGEVRDAFAGPLPPLLRAWGCDIGTILRIGDDPVVTRESLARLTAEADVVVATGGTARSATDRMRALLETRVAEESAPTADRNRIHISGLRMRPGQPTMLAVVDGTPVLALPGNPLAAMAALRVVGSALLRGLTGHPAEVPVTVPVAAAQGAQKVDRLTPAAPDPSGHGWLPRPHAAAHMLRGLADAEGWLVLRPRAVDAGEHVPFLPLV